MIHRQSLSLISSAWDNYIQRCNVCAKLPNKNGNWNYQANSYKGKWTSQIAEYLLGGHRK